MTPDPVTRPSWKVDEPTQADLASDHSAPALADTADDRSSIPVTMDDESDPDRTVELPKIDAKASVPDDGVDVEVETDEPSPRSSEPEIGAEDLVSIESVPAPVKKKSVPPGAPPMPLAYQSGDFLAQPSAPNLQAAAPVVVVPPTSTATATAAPATASPLAAQPPPATTTSAVSAAAADAKKRVRPWWEDLFNDDFVRTMAKISDTQIGREASFIEESLGVESGSALLDLGCGTGLHAIELTKRGYNVVGFDLSLAMLAKAADEAQDRKQKLNFVQGDMREMAFDELFDGVYSWNTSFGFFDEEKNGQVVQRVHRALKKGGQFLLDVINRDYLIRQSPSLAWFEGDGCICMDEMQVDFITSRMRIKRTMMMDDGRSREIEYSMRVYSLHELGKILH
ncbi:MAG: methyltransferase domain-containing protein, partial [Polyangiaceae bacterium]